MLEKICPNFDME